MESCAAETSEAPLPATAETMPPKKVRVQKPRAKLGQQTAADPPPHPAIVVDAPFFAALGGTLRSFQRDDRRAKLFALRVA